MNQSPTVKYLRFEEKLPLDFETKVQTLARSHPMEFIMYLQIGGDSVLMELTDSMNPQNQLCINVKSIRDDKIIKTAIRTCIAHFKISECELRIRWQLFATIKSVMAILKKTKISSVYMEQRKETEIHPEEVLDALRKASNVTIFWDCEGFYPKTKVKPFHFEKLDMKEAKWVTGKHLTRMFMDCKHLILNRSVLTSTQQELNRFRLTNSEIKTFLKRWMEGSNLRRIETGIKTGINLKSVMKGLEAIPVEKDWSKAKNGGCYKIKQKNGLELFVYRDPEFTLTTEDLLKETHFVNAF
ncbi:unnamed protein product [Caenorhabditis nigoni]